MAGSLRVGRSVLLSLVIVHAGCGREPTENPGRESGTWRTYLGDESRSHYSSLKEINRSNVEKLQQAWTYHTGDAGDGDDTQIQCNPIIVGPVLYATTPRLKVVALDAATGAPRWTFDPFASQASGGAAARHVNRGVSYWEEGGDRRILFTAGPYLYALEADTGAPVLDFGDGGRVDLREGLGRDAGNLFVIATTPGAVYRDLLILGSRVSEGSDAAPGYIRAFSVRSGKLKWTFHTIPLPGEPGHETWPPEAWKEVGGANAWAGMAVDSDRGMVFASTGSAAYDFYGGNRAGDDLFANCVLALDAASGRLRWYFQTVHHDLWDRDLPAAPTLVTVRQNSRRIDAVAQITKSGYVFLLDRDTGESLFPIEERTVPASRLPGETTSPTQPFPLKPPPFARQRLDEKDLTERTPEAAESVRRRFQPVWSDGQFTPPSLQGTIVFPGFDGGGEWGGGAFDPETDIFYVNSNEMAWILTMIPGGGGSEWASAGAQIYSIHCASCHGVDRQGDSRLKYPPLIDLQARYQAAQVRDIVADGKGDMPALGLTPAEREAVAAYLLDAPQQSLALPAGDRSVKSSATPFIHTGWNRFLDPEGYPAVSPPWGTLNAIDLGRGELLWQVTLGELEELTRQGVPPTGTENYGGPVVTAGGLIFIAATKDGMFRAFDKRTGKVLWRTRLPAGGYATPAVYEAGGREFVVVAAGGGKMGTASGDSYVAFSLPK